MWLKSGPSKRSAAAEHHFDLDNAAPAQPPPRRDDRPKPDARPPELSDERPAMLLVSGFAPWWICLGALAQAAKAAPPSTQASGAHHLTAGSLCPSRTINYITHTLPQQCLRTDWSRNATAAETTASPAEGSGADPGPAAAEAILTDSAIAAVNSALVVDPNAAHQTHASESVPLAIPSGQAPSPEDVARSAQEQEEDPLSDDAHFVSFEEWKAKMLEKAGQSPENLGGRYSGGPGQEERRRPAPIHQDLDSLGDDVEIELDFRGFGSAEEVASPLPPVKNSDAQQEDGTVAADQPKRSRDAGKTSRERFNYASFDCAATVLKKNPECKGSNSILVENQDSYMLNACSATNKFFIVELCNEILIDTIALGNYEFFSSTFRQFRVSISDRYPVKADKWRELGVFEAQNTRGIQAFLIDNGLIWGRYLRIEFLSHYGGEYYCPVSLLRVHGKTMMDDYRNEMKASRGEDDPEDDSDAEAEGGLVVVARGDEQVVATTEAPVETGQAPKPEDPSNSAQVMDVLPAIVANASSLAQAAFPPNCRGPGSFNDSCPRTNYLSSLVEQAELVNSRCTTRVSFCNMELTEKIKVVDRAPRPSKPRSTPAPMPVFRDFDPPRIAATAAPIATAPPPPTGGPGIAKTSQSSHPPNSKLQPETSKLSVSSSTATQTPPPSPSPASQFSGNATDPPKVDRPSPPVGAAINATVEGTTATPTVSTRTTPAAPPASTPPTQESFFKSVHKRLQLLEANSTLSLQYIEEQSRLLREAFTKVEKRQLNKTSAFLASLNETVLSELRELRTQYDQIWQSTILELSSQREQSVKEAAGLSNRLAILADEVVWQKRLVYLQFGVLLLGLGLFTFSRGSAGSAANSYIDLPPLREIWARSPQASFRRGRLRSDADGSIRHGLETPISSPSRPNSRHGVTWGQLGTSDPDSDGEVKSADPASDYRLPTPPSENGFKKGLLKPALGLSRTDSPMPDPILRRAVSSPALGIEVQDSSEEDASEPSPSTKAEGVADAGLVIATPLKVMAET